MLFALLEPEALALVVINDARKHVRSQQEWAHPYYWAAWQLWGPLD